MATWVNLLDALYPVGAVYFSTASTSPASTIGGSWTQIKGAVIAAYGSNGYTLKNYGGSLALTNNHLPADMGDVRIRGASAGGDVNDIFVLGSTGIIKTSMELWAGTHNVINTTPDTDRNSQKFMLRGGRKFPSQTLWSLYLVSNSLERVI